MPARDESDLDRQTFQSLCRELVPDHLRLVFSLLQALNPKAAPGALLMGYDGLSASNRKVIVAVAQALRNAQAGTGKNKPFAIGDPPKQME